jgi:hypothetical protein
LGWAEIAKYRDYLLHKKLSKPKKPKKRNYKGEKTYQNAVSRWNVKVDRWKRKKKFQKHLKKK